MGVSKKDDRGNTVWEHEGLVLADLERNGYDDSDFYAVIWLKDESKPFNLTYDSTRFGCSNRKVRVDATPEIRILYEVYLKEQAKLHENKIVRIGKMVRIVSGVHRGVTGKVVWKGENAYATRHDFFQEDREGFGTSRAVRWGVEANDIRMFANGNQLELLTTEKVES